MHKFNIGDIVAPNEAADRYGVINRHNNFIGMVIRYSSFGDVVLRAIECDVKRAFEEEWFVDEYCFDIFSESYESGVEQLPSFDIEQLNRLLYCV